MPPSPALVWFRDDLRIADNPALYHARESGKPVICLYIFEENETLLPLGGASKWWLHHSLKALNEELKKLGGSLILRRGQAEEILKDVLENSGADCVYWNRRYEPNAVELDTSIKTALKEQDIEVQSFNANLLTEPWTIKTKSDAFYKVFTPYSKAVRKSLDIEKPLPKMEKLDFFEKNLTTDTLEDWNLLPTKPNWADTIAKTWKPGSNNAHERLKHFIDNDLTDYKTSRDDPAGDKTSRMSPYLKFGEISPKQIWYAVDHAASSENLDDESVFTYQQELIWREFSYNLLFNSEDLKNKNFHEKFDAFPWADMRKAKSDLKAWQKGQTGYPVVDAGMRQLWQTGWMHNRVRMIVGSFLVKHLLIHWSEGEKWFWDTLVDADSASNTASWQWVAGTGADAAPYFRIFNPILQGEKFDKKGEYVRRFVPELTKLPNKYIHKPWEAPDDILKKAGITLGETYPKPIIAHKKARERALAAYKEISNS
jgi:deoxyribodipyrimidine photo-lyase